MSGVSEILFAKKVIIIIFAANICIALLSTLMNSPSVYAYQSAKSLYGSKCAVCHANDGSGNTAKGKELKVRDLRAPEFKKMTDAKALEIILKGKGKMDGYEKSLGKEKAEQLLAYCRELANK